MKPDNEFQSGSRIPYNAKLVKKSKLKRETNKLYTVFLLYLILISCNVFCSLLVFLCYCFSQSLYANRAFL